jgi:hypothetical protein
LGNATGLDRRIHARSRREGGRTADAGGTGGTMADTSRGRHGGSRQGEVEQPGRAEAERSSCNLADTGGARLEGRERSGASDKWLWSSPSGSTAERGRPLLHPPGPADMGRWADVLSVAPYLAPPLSISDVKRAADHFAQMVARGELAETQAQSFVRLCADGMANRSRSLRLLGNGVCPLQAALAWVTLARAHGLEPAEWTNANTAGDTLPQARD